MAANSEKAAQRVAQEIVQTIYDEGLQAGDRYLSEADALIRHKVSRATFREALRFLEFQGVVRVRAGPGGGAMVRKPDWPNLTSTFALLLQFADAPLSQVMAARTVLEPAMASLAAENATPEQLAMLENLVDEAKRCIPDHMAFTLTYRAFWVTLAQTTGNAVTAIIWPSLRALVDSGGFHPNERYRQSLTERMTELLDAVRLRDAAKTRDIVAALDREFSERLQQDYPLRMSQGIAWSDVEP